MVTTITKQPSDFSRTVIVINSEVPSGTNVERISLAYETAASLFGKDTVVLILG